ncbi:uncharacterized protein LOC124300502 isoform X1 [Neodiprion virginianus]|uniref:uncharacterized protein LOC124300502 isoform X1 n=1 Tax=Neodiprion virginianus TaxID=2961670 RepID=UPI001EE73F2A|nr:uncharacterized protein LOC124300502 isoform X1 [Neodiprion virginianus]
MKCSTLALTFVFTLALGACRSSLVPSQPGAPSPVSVNELITKAQTGIAKLGTDLREVLIRPNHDAVVKALKERSSGFVTNVQSYIEQMSKNTLLLNLERFLETLIPFLHRMKIGGPDMKKMWDDFSNKLTKATDNISAYMPANNGQISQLVSKFLGGSGATVKQSESTTETTNGALDLAYKNIPKLPKKVVEITAGAAKDLISEIKDKSLKFTL